MGFGTIGAGVAEGLLSNSDYLAEKAGARIHIAHVSCKESIDVIREAKSRGVLVTAETAPHVRALLGAFLFSGDTVEKRVGVLSGGERSRLALAKLLLEPRNCLLLDEPTNHLDLPAKEVLLDALQAYGGTVVIVAHDRYILDKLPTHVIEVGSGKAVLYHGNYEDYLQAKARAEARAAAPPARAGKR